MSSRRRGRAERIPGTQRLQRRERLPLPPERPDAPPFTSGRPGACTTGDMTAIESKRATPSPLLVPVDFEPASLRAVEVAKEMAAQSGAEVIVLHACNPPLYVYPELPAAYVQRFYDDVMTAGRQALEDLAKTAGGVRAIFRRGEPRDEILGAMRELEPSMVVMGTHGRRGIRRLFLGSVAEHVLRHSNVPVLVVPAPAAEETAEEASRPPGSPKAA
jgi:nucleotide-binding universal stress UspA family protein